MLTRLFCITNLYIFIKHAPRDSTTKAQSSAPICCWIHRIRCKQHKQVHVGKGRRAERRRRDSWEDRWVIVPSNQQRPATRVRLCARVSTPHAASDRMLLRGPACPWQSAWYVATCRPRHVGGSGSPPSVVRDHGTRGPSMFVLLFLLFFQKKKKIVVAFVVRERRRLLIHLKRHAFMFCNLVN